MKEINSHCTQNTRYGWTGTAWSILAYHVRVYRNIPHYSWGREKRGGRRKGKKNEEEEEEEEEVGWGRGGGGEDGEAKRGVPGEGGRRRGTAHNEGGSSAKEE